MAKNISRADFFKKVKPVVKGLGLLVAGGSMLSACASSVSQTLSQTPAQQRGYATDEEAMRILGIKNKKQIADLGGYKTDPLTAREIRTHVESLVQERNIYDSQRNSGRGLVNVQYSNAYQDILQEILRVTDDGDLVIDREEGFNIAKMFFAGKFNYLIK